MKRIVVLLSLFIFVVLLSRSVDAQTGDSRIDVVADTSTFPLINLNVYVREGQSALNGLETANFALVNEPNQNLRVEQTQQNVILGVLIDTRGNQNDQLTLKQALRDYFATFYRDGDRVLMTVRVGDSNTVRTYDTRESINQVINALPESGTDGALQFNSSTISLMISELQREQREHPTMTVQALLFASYVDNLIVTRSDAAAFGTSRIPLHVVQAHYERNFVTETFRQIAQNNGGTFAELRNRQYIVGVQGNEQATTAAALPPYQRIESNRTYYRVSYRAISPEAGQRTVTLRVAQTVGTPIETSYTYTPLFRTPSINIVDADFNIRREFVEAGSSELTNPSQSVEVEVRFDGDGITRSISSATLRVLEAGTIRQSISPQSLNLDSANRLYFLWDLTPYSAPSSVTDLTLQVSLQDPATGMTVESELVPAQVAVGDQIKIPIEPEVRVVGGLEPERIFESAELTSLTKPVAELLVDVTLPETMGEVNALELTTTVNGQTETVSFSDPTQDANGNYRIEWSLAQFTRPSSVTPVTLVITATTSTGDVISSPSIETRVSVGALPPTPTPIVSDIAGTGISIDSTNVTGVLGSLVIAVIVSLVVIIVLIVTRPDRAVKQVAHRLKTEVERRRTEVERRRSAVDSPGGAAADFELVIITKGVERAVLPFVKSNFSIGREIGAGVDYEIQDIPGISSNHATFSQEDGRFFVTDNESTNGTRYEGRHLVVHQRQEIRPGDTVQLGNYVEVRLRHSGGGSRTTELERDLGGRTTEVESDEELLPGRITMIDEPKFDTQERYTARSLNGGERLPMQSTRGHVSRGYSDDEEDIDAQDAGI